MLNLNIVDVENEYYICKYDLYKDNVMMSIYYYDNTCTKDVIDSKESKEIGIKVFEEISSFWWLGKNIYDEIEKLLYNSDYEDGSKFKVPVDLLRKAKKNI